MPPMDEHHGRGHSSPFASLGRSLLSIRRDQVHSMDAAEWDSDLDSFQKHVADLIHSLSSAGDEDILSLSWIQKLLDAFLSCLDRFLAVLLKNRGRSLARPPLDRIAAEFFDRAVKALDVCNAIRDGIQQVRNWAKLLDIVLAALGGDGKAIREGQFRRAKKALADFSISMLDEKESGFGGLFSHRNRSFGRHNNPLKDNNHHRQRSSGSGHARSLSWSVSRSWSAAKELQAIGNNIAAPRSTEIVATNGMAVLVYTMSEVLLFVLWALVAAIPCQDRGLQVHFSVPRNYAWAGSILSMHERISDESKKRNRRNSNGLLKEIQRIENSARNLMDLMDANEQFPLAEETVLEIRQGVDEIANVGGAMKDGLDLLERKARDVFHRIARCRAEGLDCMGKSASS